MAKNTPATKNKHTPQNILNWSFDEDFSILSVGLLGYDLENGGCGVKCIGGI